MNGNIAHLVTRGPDASWIDTFLSYTDGITSSRSHRLWAGITAIAGALERKVWIQSQRSKIYPNFYVFLAGPPGTGKTRALMACHELWAGLGTHHVARLSLTKAAFIDELVKAKTTTHYPDPATVINSLLVAAPELAVLLPGYDSEFMNVLTHLYDCIGYSESRRTSKEGPIDMALPVVNLIACTTPGFLVNALPPGAWNEGFMSRVIIAYNDEKMIKELGLTEEEEVIDPRTKIFLQNKMKHIGALQGRMGWDDDAAKLAEHWNSIDFNSEKDFPKPKHPRLLNYNTRRPVHFLKLCMISAVDRGAFSIACSDCYRARTWLVTTEENMPDLFHQMAAGGDSQTIDDCWHFVLTKYHKNAKKDVPLADVKEFLYHRASAQHVDKLIELMKDMKMIQVHNSTVGPVVKPREYPSKH